MLPLSEYTPSVPNTRMPEYSSARGISRTFTHTRISGRFSASSMMLPMYSEAISVHTSSLLFSNSSGPGCRLKIWKAASMIAAVALVGMPEREQRHERPAERRVVRRLGPGDAFDRALAELLAVAG